MPTLWPLPLFFAGASIMLVTSCNRLTGCNRNKTNCRLVSVARAEVLNVALNMALPVDEAMAEIFAMGGRRSGISDEGAGGDNSRRKAAAAGTSASGSEAPKLPTTNSASEPWCSSRNARGSGCMNAILVWVPMSAPSWCMSLGCRRRCLSASVSGPSISAVGSIATAWECDATMGVNIHATQTCKNRGQMPQPFCAAIHCSSGIRRSRTGITWRPA
mmetsp:Transcript_48552/g.135689  ORF Transcript_48552/g.135689 Transcript_48552/m.135689 type:complete len:217 (-) Transcript_48552:127-777(-)